MAVYFAGGEPSDFSGTFGAWSTSTSRFRSAYARGAIQCDESLAPIANFAPIGPTIWLGLQHYILSSWSSITEPWVDFRFNDQAFLRINSDSTAAQATIQVYSSGSWTTIGAFTTVISATLHKIDVEVVINSSTGSVRVYEDGAIIAELTGVNTQGDNPGTTFDSISFALEGSSSNGISEVVVADEDTRNFSVHTLYPASAGGLSEWAGNFGDIAADGSVSSSSIVSASAGEQFVFSHPQSYAGGENIKAVILNARAAADGSGPSRLKALQRIGGTAYEGASIAVSTVKVYPLVMAAPPDGDASWTVTKINSSQFGWKSGS